MLSPPCALWLHSASGPIPARGSASRRRASGPAEMGRSEEPPQRPAGVIVDVGDEMQFPARLHHPRERLDHGVRNDATLVVAPLRPGVGIKDEDAGKKSVRRGLDHRLGVAAPQPDVDEILALDPRQRRDDAVEKRLAADEADVRTGPRRSIRCSPEPKPISSQTSRGSNGKSAGRASASGAISTRGKTSASRRCCPGRSALPRLRPYSVRRGVPKTPPSAMDRCADASASGETAQRVGEVRLFP